MPAMFVMVTGCVSQNPSISGIPFDSHLDKSQADASANLSTKTVRPEGFDKFLGVFTPYRVTIQQGNFISQEMASQVKEGMTREQVRFILGTALLTDMFHADRWDYIFRLLKPSGELITSRVTVYFDQSLVAKIERGELPNEKEYLTRITDAAIVEKIEHLDTTRDKPKPKNND